MDKLKPVIEQKFWIFLGLALLLPFIGWYLATSDYAQGVQEREQTIEGAFDSMGFTRNVPNKDWVEGANKFVVEEQTRFTAAQNDLWNSQKQSMIWPEGVQSHMKNVAYEGEIDANVREYYSQNYFRQLKDMEKRLKPFDYATGEGVLLFNPASYTHVPEHQWDTQAPTSKEMWDAQIDIWLVRAVFDSIIAMNKSYDKITEAPIRQLVELTLRGGERDYSGAADGADGSTETETTTSDGDMYAGAGSGFSGTGGSGESFKMEAKFDLSEELGPAGSDAYGGSSSDGDMGDMFANESAPGGDDSGTTAVAGPVRYVDDKEGDPFRTRAFVLGVVMDHRLLPEFMAELSRSDWPIQIIRVQTKALNLDELPVAGRMGGGVRPGMAGAGPGMGGSIAGFGPTYGSESTGEGYGGGGAGSFGGIPGLSTGGSYGGSKSTYGGSQSTYGGAGSVYGGSRPGIPGGITGGAAGNTPGARNAVGLAHQAMGDPYLAEVWIGGLITLFRPVEEEDTTGINGAQSPGMNLGSDPIGGDAALVDPNGTLPDNATPGEEPGTATPVPVDGASTPGAEGTTVPGTAPSSPGVPPATETPQTAPDTKTLNNTDN